MLKLKDGFTGERSIVLPPMVTDIERNDPLTSSLYITDIGYYPHADHHFRERLRPISQHVLIYCVEGSGWFRVDGPDGHVSGQTSRLAANQYCILPAGIPHAYGADETDPWTIYWVHFCGPHADVYAHGAQEPQSISPAVNSRIFERTDLFEDIFHTLENGYSLENLRYASSLLHYYLASMRYLTLYRRTHAGETDVVGSAIHFMKEHIERKITLSEIAAYTGYSASHFAALFKQRTGMAPLNYYNQLKIQQACQLLASTDMKINQVSLKVGIDDCYYFSRLFSQMMKMSPKRYRECQREGLQQG